MSVRRWCCSIQDINSMWWCHWMMELIKSRVSCPPLRNHEFTVLPNVIIHGLVYIANHRSEWAPTWRWLHSSASLWPKVSYYLSAWGGRLRNPQRHEHQQQVLIELYRDSQTDSQSDRWALVDWWINKYDHGTNRRNIDRFNSTFGRV